MARKSSGPSWFKVWGHTAPLLEAVPDEVAGRAFKAVLRYFNTGEIQEGLGQLETVVYAQMIPDVDDAYADYMARQERNRANISKRWGNKGIPLDTSGNHSIPLDTTRYQSVPNIPEGEREGEEEREEEGDLSISGRYLSTIDSEPDFETKRQRAIGLLKL